MSFFDDIPIAPPEPEPEPVLPEWHGPPRDVLPAISQQRSVLFTTDNACLFVDRFLVYPTGVSFSVGLRQRTVDDEMADPPWEIHRRRGRVPDDVMRFGILFSDGSRWTNLDPFPHFTEAPTGPVVWARGGGGGGGEWSMRYWLWPLPPEGELTFVVEWPGGDVPETRTTVDANELRSLAAAAQPIWPTD